MRSALSIREKILEPDNPELCSTLLGLAELLWKKADIRAAELLYRRALAIEEKAFGGEDRGLIPTLHQLGRMLTQNDEYGAA